MEQRVRAEEISWMIEEAVRVRQMAYAPYSGFLVGAALLCRSGRIYTGCNIENAAFSPTNCAERTAFFKAVSEGEREFAAIAIAGGHKDSRLEYCPPCGVCRQVRAEFCDADRFVIYLARSVSDYKEYRLKDMLPFSFGL